MKATDKNITLKDLEQLCQLYLDCRLSVLEENELEYVLQSCPEFHSPLVDDTRRLMGISHSLELRNAGKRRSIWHRKGMLISGVAAAVAVVFVLTPFFQTERPYADSRCVAYVGGKHLTGDDAEKIVEAQMAKTDAFMQKIESKKAESKEIFDISIHQKIPSL